LSHYEGLPVYITQATFGGAPDLGNVCSNGGGLSSIGVSYTVLNSLFSHNRAIGSGANPQRPGTPSGGGCGGGIYNDGNTFAPRRCGTRTQDNSANEGGGAIFFVTNNTSGDLVIEDSVLAANPSLGFETSGLPASSCSAMRRPSPQRRSLARPASDRCWHSSVASASADGHAPTPARRERLDVGHQPRARRRDELEREVGVAVVEHPAGVDEAQRLSGVGERAWQSLADPVVWHVMAALRHALDHARLAERSTREADVHECDAVAACKAERTL
jgi:hypothetical protein